MRKLIVALAISLCVLALSGLSTLAAATSGPPSCSSPAFQRYEAYLDTYYEGSPLDVYLDSLCPGV